jgi:hypothetical protein
VQPNLEQKLGPDTEFAAARCVEVAGSAEQKNNATDQREHAQKRNTEHRKTKDADDEQENADHTKGEGNKRRIKTVVAASA